MPSFSKGSKKKLMTVHPKLQEVLNDAIQYTDFTVVEGVRTADRQEELVRTGMSKTLNSKHLEQDDGWSHAVDIAPYVATHPTKIPWDEHSYFYVLHGYIMSSAQRLGVKLRWGGDFNSNGIYGDTSFFDAPHYEIIL